MTRLPFSSRNARNQEARNRDVRTAPTLSRLALSVLAVTAQLAPALVPGLFAGQAAAAAVCASPGTGGPGGTLSGVVNTYFVGGASAAAGATSITLGAVSGAKTTISAGDLLLVIQMQGATINAANTTAYGANNGSGSGSTARTAGTYEYVKATSAGSSGGSVSVSGGGGAGLLNAYTATLATTTAGKSAFQVIVVPQYSSATLGSGLTAKAWDGAAGGVLALDVSGPLALGGATVSVSGLGFRGGGGRALTGTGNATTATNTDYVNSSQVAAHGSKAEGTAGTPRYTWVAGASAITDNGTANGTTNPEGYPGGSNARGAPGTAGGGGTDADVPSNDDNSGGGGGGGGGAGGLGGNSWAANSAVGGIGGAAFPAAATKLVLGGGGGAGSRNDGSGTDSSGGAGGGMVFVRAGSLSGTGTFAANGTTPGDSANDGAGGGGAGGSLLVYTAGSSGTLTLNANGAAGANAWPTQAAGTNNSNAHGPGGGGGGGAVYTNATSSSTTVAAGAHGTTTTAALQYGSASGAAGVTGTLTATSTPGVSSADNCTAGALTFTKKQRTATGTLTTAGVNVKPGDTLHYQLGVTNSTYLSRTAVTFTDTVPSYVTPASTGTLTCPDGSTRTVSISSSLSVNVVSTCGLPLKPQQSATLDFDTTVN